MHYGTGSETLAVAALLLGAASAVSQGISLCTCAALCISSTLYSAQSVQVTTFTFQDSHHGLQHRLWSSHYACNAVRSYLCSEHCIACSSVGNITSETIELVTAA